MIKKSSYYINIFKKMWKNHKWELVIALSILFLIVCYFRQHTEEYKGINCNLDILRKKQKKGGCKHEDECKRILEKQYNKKFTKIRPEFLKNPKSGRNLELDMYNNDLKLALEYQGAQHRVYTPYFHKSYEDFLSQVERDTYKKKKCEEEGIKLICVPDTVKYKDLETYIKSKL